MSASANFGQYSLRLSCVGQIFGFRNYQYASHYAREQTSVVRTLRWERSLLEDSIYIPTRALIRSKSMLQHLKGFQGKGDIFSYEAIATRRRCVNGNVRNTYEIAFNATNERTSNFQKVPKFDMTIAIASSICLLSASFICVYVTYALAILTGQRAKTDLPMWLELSSMSPEAITFKPMQETTDQH